MAEIRAFKGLRFNTDKAGTIDKLCCPPYDIISEDQRRAFLQTNEHNIIRLELPKEGANPYATAKEVLDNWKNDGILMFEDKPALYIYEEEFTAYGKRNSIKGLIARVKVEEFSKGIILPHEFTLSKAKEDRLNLMKATNCNFSQIYALYMDSVHHTQALLEANSQTEPVMEYTDDDNVTHRMWIVTDEAVINDICKDFDDRKLFIADGHHRYETALNYRNYCRDNGISKEGDAQDYQMIFLMDMGHSGLVVFPTHRIIRDLQEFDGDSVLQKCKQYFDITQIDDVNKCEGELAKLYDNGEKAFGFYFDSKCYILKFNCKDKLAKIFPDISAELAELDVTILHTLILERLMGIDKENMANQINLTYTKKFEEAISSVDNKSAQATFILNPTRVTQIRDVAANGEKMPQKSTYFYPKMITGMVMNELI